jgi:hypothetical protein
MFSFRRLFVSARGTLVAALAENSVAELERVEAP